MSRFVVEGPDGRRYVVEGPTTGAGTGAGGGLPPTPPPQGAPEPARRSLGGSLASYGRSARAGVADAVISTGLGLKQLFGGLSDQDKLALKGMEMSQAEEENKWARGGANLATNVAALAIPGAAAEKGARAAIGAGSVLQRALSAGVGSGATEFLTSVGEGDTYGEQVAGKLKNAGVAAATGGLMQGGLEKIARPFKATQDAEKLFAQGINPTLQQAAEGKFVRKLAGVAAGALDSRGRQEQEIADALFRRVTDNNATAQGGIGRDYAGLAGDYVSSLYDDILATKQFRVTPSVLKKTAATAGRLNQSGQMQRQAAEAAGEVENILGDLARGASLNSKGLRDRYLTPLAEAAAAQRDPNVRQRIKDARNLFVQQVRDKRLTPDELAAITKYIDPKYYDVSRMREATRGVSGELEGMNLTKLGRAYANAPNLATNTTAEDLINPALRVLGETPNQEQSRLLAQGVRKATGWGRPAGVTAAASMVSPLVGVPVGIGAGLSLVGQTAAGARALTGQTAAQKKMARLLREGVLVGPFVSPLQGQDYPTEENYAP